jgi:hypothetical protein
MPTLFSTGTIFIWITLVCLQESESSSLYLFLQFESPFKDIDNFWSIFPARRNPDKSTIGYKRTIKRKQIGYSYF